ncbi:DUF3883 domain-containing protein [Inhella crocodyli]|uniref:DUF3883 domain-containing protein n=1 Tax=Inhella crocodyli TaxID=2499851 RepID=A0A3S2XR51_9BURK|nr:DUF3883 domain-containing protein [Inhella crocodyli]RVT84968.1 DUF3883 domain-containing protein [Inhella crocodyli]
MIAFSPGLAQGCFELLAITARQKLTFTEIKGAFAYLGSLPAQKVVETAQALNWLQASELGHAEHTPWGSRLFATPGYETQLRQALLDYIDIEHPSWVQNASFGRSRVISFAGSQIAQVFAEAGLADGTSEPVVAFWDALAARARGQRDDRLSQIGRLGERLTIDYETQRTGRHPTWVAIDNNADGYDVLSVVGPTDLHQLTIEVKTSTQGTSGFAMLTRNEWEMAIESERHAFYFWDLGGSSKPKLAIVSSEAMLEHMPQDQGAGQWDCAKIPFSAFKHSFA